MNKFLSSFYNKYTTIVNKHAPMKNLSNRKEGSYLNPRKVMELRRLLKLEINYMHLETKLGTNTIERIFVHLHDTLIDK